MLTKIFWKITADFCVFLMITYYLLDLIELKNVANLLFDGKLFSCQQWNLSSMKIDEKPQVYYFIISSIKFFLFMNLYVSQ